MRAYFKDYELYGIHCAYKMNTHLCGLLFFHCAFHVNLQGFFLCSVIAILIHTRTTAPYLL